jgi:uncharacterized protein YndB with AHSA1/START domain
MATRQLEPVVKEVTVAAGPEAAFRRFTDGIGDWWPLATHSVGEEMAEAVSFPKSAGGRIVERTKEGAEHLWGTVTAWEPPDRVVFTWHPGRAPETAQEVEVTFEAVPGGGTRVTVVHGGWERYGDGAAEQRDRYVPGWEMVLGRYVASLAEVRPGAD